MEDKAAPKGAVGAKVAATAPRSETTHLKVDRIDIFIRAIT